MTSEIVILNRNAVAMAADSAVTLSNGKIYNTANKLFMLSSNHPVGVMLYNQTSFLGLPWEILISDFGKYLSESDIKKKNLKDYFDEFNNWLKTNQHIYCSDEQNNGFSSFIINNTLVEIGQDIWKEIWDFYYKKATKISESKLLKTTKEILQKKIDILNKAHKYFDEDESNDIRKKIFTQYKNLISENIIDLFENIPLDADDINKIDEIIYLTFTRDSNMYTGVVFAGYGEEDLLPSCICYRYEDPVCDYLKKRKLDDESMDISLSDDGVVAAIVPLAQKDVIHNFLSGIHPNLNRTLVRLLRKKMSDTDVKEIFSTIDESFISPHKQSILDAVNSLPKEELATMAETLVGLTSFMRKVSMDPDTVGGPVDVAVISRIDGFVWINRKMYFANEKNLHLHYN